MLLSIEELKNAQVKREYRVWIELNSSGEFRGVRIKIVERAITFSETQECEILRDTYSEFYSQYNILNEVDKIVSEIKEKQLKTSETLKALIELFSKLGIEEIYIDEDP
ncbi:MAG: hypothetical protein QXJ14_02585 [Candidatus Aenigmatarchaeota archaeon]